MGTFSRVK